jgi:hypothetical protein
MNGLGSSLFQASSLQQAILKISESNEPVCSNSNTYNKDLVYCAFDKQRNHESNACFGGKLE